MGIIREIIDIVENYDKIKAMFRKLIFRLEYQFLWSKEEKRKSEELIKKHKLPKDIIATKGVVVATSYIRRRKSNNWRSEVVTLQPE